MKPHFARGALPTSCCAWYYFPLNYMFTVVFYPKSQVTACITRVEDILDLKFCTDGVQTALQNEDYEKASVYKYNYKEIKDY